MRQNAKPRATWRTAALLPASIFLLTACSAVPRDAATRAWAEYSDTLRRLEAGGAALEPGSEAERLAVDRFQRLLSDFKAPDFRADIRRVYAEDVFFNDTLKTLRGVAEVEAHLAATAEALDAGTVEFVDLVSENGNFYFRWELKVRAKRIAGGEERRSFGMSHVRFDASGRVALHQDFWDSTSGLFEQVPALGWMLRRAKARL